MNSEAPEVQPSEESEGPDAVVEQAWKDFMVMFEQHCTIPLAAPAGKEELKRVFDLTVAHAITERRMPWNPETKRFPLGRVKEIAILSKRLACGPTVSPTVLMAAADRVIAYWEPICLERLTAERASGDVLEKGRTRLVWCTQYRDEMRPIDPLDSDAF